MSARIAARRPSQSLRQKARPAARRVWLRHPWDSLVEGKQVAVGCSRDMATMRRTAERAVYHAMFSLAAKLRRTEASSVLAWWRLLCLQTMHPYSSPGGVLGWM